jgi:hypothetical protein
MAFLTRIDPTRNINRFYVVQVMPTLFGDWSVMREWGRCGSAATQCAVRPRPPSSARSSAACGGVTSSQAGEAMAQLRPATLHRPAALASKGDDGAAAGCNPRHREAKPRPLRPASFRRPGSLAAEASGAVAARSYLPHREAKPRSRCRLFRQSARSAHAWRCRARAYLATMFRQLPGARCMMSALCNGFRLTPLILRLRRPVRRRSRPPEWMQPLNYFHVR